MSRLHIHVLIAFVACGQSTGSPKPAEVEPQPAAQRQAEADADPDAEVAAAIAGLQLSHTHASLDALGEAFVAALDAADGEALAQLLVTKEEHDVLFPALVNDPRARTSGAALAWMNLSASSREALGKLLQHHAGQGYTFVRLQPRGTRPRPGLLEHRNPQVVVTRPDGTELAFDALGPVLQHEASGHFKLLSFRDRP